MELGTSTNLLYGRPGGKPMPLQQSLQMMAAAGFTVFDLNCYDWTLPGSPLLEDNWEHWLEGIAAKTAELNLSFKQCHAYFYPFLSPRLTPEEHQHHRKLQRRSFICCARLGASTIVLHPETDFDAEKTMYASKQRNAEYFYGILEETAAYGFSIAVENMCDYAIAPKRKFCATSEELVDFIDAMNDSRMGICWDFEHADIMQQNQRQALLHIGRRLYATHVSDTHSPTDSTKMHVLPMLGNINWQESMAALGDIGYNNVLCFEVHNYTNKLPHQALPSALRLAFTVGECLLHMATGKQQQN